MVLPTLAKKSMLVRLQFHLVAKMPDAPRPVLARSNVLVGLAIRVMESTVLKLIYVRQDLVCVMIMPNASRLDLEPFVVNAIKAMKEMAKLRVWKLMHV
jgi:hypothetical protein